MKWLKASLVIIAACIVSSVLPGLFGLNDAAAFVLGVLLGLGAFFYANYRWELV